MTSSHQVYSDRTSKICDIGDAHGVAILSKAAGLDVEYVPFRHAPLLDNEIRIRVTDSGLCQSDAFMMKNAWGISAFPLVAGHEILGIVTHIGEKVTKFQVGDRVGQEPLKDSCEHCHDCMLGFTNVCSQNRFTIGQEFGGFATSFQSRANNFTKIPDIIPGSAAPLMCAGTTVYSPLSRDLSPGMKVGIIGVGGLGHLGIMYANKMGCEVTAISTSLDKEAEAKSFGAHHFLVSKDLEAVKNAERTLDYILDTATVYSLDMSTTLLKPRGVVNIVGAPDDPKHHSFNAFSAVSKNLTIKGSAAGSRLETEKMIEFSARHSVYPKSEVYKFSDFNLALDSLARGIPRAPRYRAVLETASFFENFTPSN
ncbi:hypothetical protein SteCoe_7887 [Stentor coeruleus]|uniref:Enoyl reductase (ER) domain-containing protein n=1 Tax=Stentor coeruleus TaxID=5963 RepID=A0A1R2CLK9_9CILI|nr:hypothetical protein SteCoe_7887 [Stentor coeruleus]